jgi:hypothetical protein
MANPEPRLTLARGSFPLSADGRLAKDAALECPRYGVYALICRGRLLRFGETGSAFGRIKLGFNQKLLRSDGSKNYAAYHFRAKYAGEKLEVRFYSLGSEALAKQTQWRAVEAELAYQYRKKHHRWPECMTLIHFCNDMSPELRSFVAAVLKDVERSCRGISGDTRRDS